MKRSLASLLALALLCALAACGGAPAEATPTAALPGAPVSAPAGAEGDYEYFWTPEEAALPWAPATVSASLPLGGRLYLAGLDQDGAAVLGWSEPESGETRALALPEGCAYVYALGAAEAGGFDLLYGEPPVSYVTASGYVANPGSAGPQAIARYDADGALTGVTALGGAYPETGFGTLLALEDGWLLASSGALLRLDADGAERLHVPVMQPAPLDMFGALSGVFRSGERLLAVAEGVLCELDPDTLGLTPLGYPCLSAAAGLDGAVLLADLDGLARLGDGEPEWLFYWAQVGADFELADWLWELPDGRVCAYGGYADRVHTARLVAFPPRTELVMAVEHSWMHQDLVLQFNALSTSYRITMQEYGYDMESLRLALTDGEAPDIFAFSAVSSSALNWKDAFEDLAPWLEDDPDYGLGDFLPGLAAAMTGSGEVTWLPYGLQLVSYAMPGSVAGARTGLTFAELDALLAAQPAEVGTFPMWYDSMDLLMDACGAYISQAIDLEAGTCDFDNAGFIEMLERYGAHDGVHEEGMPSDLAPYLFHPYMGGIAGAGFYERIYGFRDPVLTGLPMPDGGNGCYLRIETRLSMSAQSENKEGVWEFLRFTMGDDMQRRCAIPSLDAALVAKLDELVAEESLQPELAEQYLALLRPLENVVVYDDTITGIIREEAAAYFAGDKTAADAARLIQERVSLYLAEVR